MTDFYTKKQKKFWCDKCRIFIEYNKSSIDKHNSSRSHMNNIASEGKYQSIKKKYEHYLTGLSNNNKEEGVNVDSNVNNKFIGKKVHRNHINEQYNRESMAYLKEIKNEIMKDQVINIRSSQDENKPKKIWGVFWDETYFLPYYYNFITGESVWEKPNDYDGKQEEIAQLNNANNYNVKVNDLMPNMKEGVVGKWETVDESKSVFGKRKKSEDNANTESVLNDNCNSNTKKNNVK